MALKLQARLGTLHSAVACRGELVPVAGRPPAPALRTPRDVLDLLEEAAAAVRADPFTGTTAKARALGRLAAVALKAIEANNVVARVQMLEAVLKQRPAGGVP
jgi:hypothetical protein